VTWRVEVRARLGSLDLEVAIDGDRRPTALVGPNGSGKTTLLRMIAGALAPTAGQIRLGDRTLFDSKHAIELAPEERRVGYVPQGYGLFPHLRVADNVAFGLCFPPRRQPRSARREAATELLAELGCAHLAERSTATLSGGEQQRVALARALIVDPAILLLDEPLAALDASSRRSMREFLAAHVTSRAKPAIIVTHDARDVLALDAFVLVLEHGRILQRGTAAELRAHPANDFVAELFDPAAVPISRGVY